MAWEQFYRKLKQQGLADDRIVRLWPDYQAGKSMPLGINVDNTVMGKRSSPSASSVFGDGAGLPALPKGNSIVGGTAASANSIFADGRGPVASSPTAAQVFGDHSSGASRTGAGTASPEYPYSAGRFPGKSAQDDRIIGGTVTSNGRLPGKTNTSSSGQHADAWDYSALDKSRPRLTGKANDFGLNSLLEALQSRNTPTPDFQYNDFTNQANDVAAQNFAPQYQALQLAQQNAQGQYNTADPIVKGLYEKLAADIHGQAAQTQANYAQAGTDRAAQGSQLQQGIANTYNSTQNNQADLLAKLGIQDAAPQTLQQGTGDSAWQQGQVQQGTQQQLDFLKNAGNSSTDYQNNIANASATQGAVARQGLIGQLSSALSQIDAQRLGVASNQSQAASTLGQTLSQNDYGRQKDMYTANADAQKTALDNLSQAYSLRQGVDTTNYQRAMDAAGMQQTASKNEQDYQLAVAKMSQLGFADQSTMEQAATRLNHAYGDMGIGALSAASNVAAKAGSGDSGMKITNAADYIAAVIAEGRNQGVDNQAALIDAANELLKTMNLSTSGPNTF